MATLSLDGRDWTVYWLHPTEWLSRRVWEQEPPEAAPRRIAARVPGSAQDALIDAAQPDDEVLGHLYAGLNVESLEWVSKRDWVFEKRFEVPADLEGSSFRLRFDGIDDAAHVFLNGERVGDHTGQLVPPEWRVTEQVRPGEENRLLVVIERAPEMDGLARRWKSRFAYGTDFSPRLVPIGLWDPVSLLVTGPAWFRGVAIHTNISIDQSEAALSIVSEFAATDRIRATVVTQITLDGLPVTSVEDPITLFQSDTSLVQSCEIPRVRLWWPNGLGARPLYQARLTLIDDSGRILDQKKVEFGVRKIEAVPCDGAAPDTLPYGISVNGKRVWIKGWNWVPQDQLYAVDSPERYEALLQLAKDAHVNMLRVWGGGLLEKEIFYQLCDRFGIMVWQDFPLTSPASDPAFLDYIREQAEEMIPRRRNHPSLAVWCGGDELTDEHGRPLGSDHPALAELRISVETDDPQRIWLPTTPSGPHFQADRQRRGELHDVHGPQLWLGLREHPSFYNQIDPHLHSAFGCEGVVNPETLRLIFSGEAPSPSKDDPVWTAHGGAGWLPETLEAAFGPIVDVDALVQASQMLQAMGLQYAVESNRRRKWRCAGTLPWQFNEPWPNAIGANAVDYFGTPKPAYYAVKRAYSPFHVSAAFDTFTWAGEARFRADVWLHNSGEERSLLNVVATVTDLRGRDLYQENLAVEAPDNSAENVGDLAWTFPPNFAEPFILFLEVIDEEGETIARNQDLHSRAPDPPFAGYLEAAATELELLRSDEGMRLRNVGSTVALGVTVSSEGGSGDGAFALQPGAERFWKIPYARVTAWNAGAKSTEGGNRI